MKKEEEKQLTKEFTQTTQGKILSILGVFATVLTIIALIGIMVGTVLDIMHNSDGKSISEAGGNMLKHVYPYLLIYVCSLAAYKEGRNYKKD